MRTAEASLAQYRRQAAQDENALRLLLGAALPPALQAALDRQGFREVSDALASQSTYREQLEAERKLVAADQQDYDLSLMRFHAGIDTSLSTLVAQRYLFSARLDLISI